MEHNRKHIAENFSRVVEDIRQIINAGRNAAYAAVDASMIATYWNIGRRIVEEEQHGQERARYGQELIKTLADELTHEYGSGYTDRYLRAFRQFYLVMPNYQIYKMKKIMKEKNQVVPDEVLSKEFLASSRQKPM